MTGQFAVEDGQFDANSAQKPQPEMAACFLWESSETMSPFQLATCIAGIEAVDHSMQLVCSKDLDMLMNPYWID